MVAFLLRLSIHVFLWAIYWQRTPASEAIHMCLYWAIYWQCATSKSSILNNVMGRNTLAV